MGKVRDGDTIHLRIDTRALSGTVDVVSIACDEFLARQCNPLLQADPRVPDDTRLWAALQNASGGSWAGCVYDAARISELLARGLAAELGSPLPRAAAARPGEAAAENRSPLPPGEG